MSRRPLTAREHHPVVRGPVAERRHGGTHQPTDDIAFRAVILRQSQGAGRW